MISCILLSAGSSSRFGGPKALAVLDQTPVIEHLQNVLISSNVFEVIVVLGAASEKIEPHLLNHKKITCVHNKDYHLGQMSSFKIGLGKVSQKSLGVMLLPIDYPLVKIKTINALCQYFLESHPAALIPTYQDRKGHPPIFHANLIPQLSALANSTGLNVFEEEMKSKTVLYPVNDPEGPFGAKGMGEASLLPTAAAIANAIDDAVGVRIKELPITPDKILKALKEKET